MEMNSFCNELLHDMTNGVSMAKQIVSGNTDIHKAVIENIQSGIDALDAKARLIVIDAKDTANYAELLRHILDSSFADPKFTAEDTWVEKADYEDCIDEGELGYQAQCLLSDFADNGIATLLVIDNYDAVKPIWESRDYGNMRALVSSSDGLSILLLSDKSAFEVSEEPAGSSPFYNIFDEPKQIEV